MKLTPPTSRSLGVAVVVVVGVAIFAGSIPTSTVGPAENAGLERAVGKIQHDGGKLILGSARLCDSFDPAKSFDTWCSVVFRLYDRNLMAFSGQAGSASLQTQPDLARAIPKVNTDKTKWTFKLRRNIRWDDGTAVTAQDVKYSIERLYAPTTFGTVNSDYLCLLSNCVKGMPAYRGPDKKHRNHLTTIQTFGDDTVIFNLKSPRFDFDRILALPQFSIIQRSREFLLQKHKHSYGYAPSSNGPFVLLLNNKAKTAKFVRNKYWVQASDAIRSPHVSNIAWTVFKDNQALDIATVENRIDIRLGTDFGLQNSSVASVANKNKTQIDRPFTGFTNFLVVRPQTAPLNRVACRQAIFYALDKSSLLRIRGGDDTSALATSLIPPGVPGYSSGEDPYASLSSPTGNLDEAQSALKRCGYPEGFEITMAYLNIGVGTDLFRSVQSSLARIGIVVVPKRFDNYANFISVTRNYEELANENISLIFSGAQTEIGSPIDYWSDFVDGRLVKPFDNQNLAMVNDPEINAKLDGMLTSPDQAPGLSAEINSLVMHRAIYLPYSNERLIMYRNPRVLGIYIQQALGGQYDIVNVGLKH